MYLRLRRLLFRLSVVGFTFLNVCITIVSFLEFDKHPSSSIYILFKFSCLHIFFFWIIAILTLVLFFFLRAYLQFTWWFFLYFFHNWCVYYRCLFVHLFDWYSFSLFIRSKRCVLECFRMREIIFGFFQLFRNLLA